MPAIPPPYVQPTPQVQRQYVCYRAPSEPRIDGRLDKDFWKDAPWTEAFVDIEGDAKPAPRFRTRVKMLWDDTHLYVAAELEEPHVWAKLTERDSIVFHDNDFEVFLNPTGDNHRYYEIEVNARNTIFDLYLAKPYRDEVKADHAWDARGMLSAVRIDGTLNDPADVDRGWSVELALPWAALDRHDGPKCPPKDGDQWRVNFSRVEWDTVVKEGRYVKVADRDEHNWVWSPQGIVDMHRPEQWGYVQFAGTLAGKGTAVFNPEPTAAARKILHRVYYAQRRYHREHDEFAGSLADLGLGDLEGVRLALTEVGWTARATTPAGVICIRQDSLVWSEPAR